jgi:DNA-binding NarL/FixJ family response regulator
MGAPLGVRGVWGTLGVVAHAWRGRDGSAWALRLRALFRELKLVKRIRSDAIHKDVPIVIITTEGSSEDRQRALMLGATAYITKPIQAPQVISKVKDLLKIE